MTSINGTNPYAQYGSAYARAAATQPSLADTLNAAEAGNSNPLDPNAATNLTLSDAAKAKLASDAKTPDFTAVTNNARAVLDKLYAAAKVTSPLGADGKTTIDLSSLDRRSLFAIATNSGGKFTPDEQSAASGELTNRFNAALAPAAAATSMTRNYTVVYKAALDYLDGASSEEKATAAWSAQRAAVQKGYDAAKQKPDTAPSVSGDPVASYLAKYPDGAPVGTTKTFGTVATDARAALDAQAKLAAENKTELVYDPSRKFGQLVDFSSFDNRSLSAITLNQDQKFSNQEIYAAKKELDSRNRANILSSLKQSQQSGDPTQLSLGILQSYSAMSDEERQASGWSPSFRDNVLQSYKSTSNILSIMNGA